MFPYWSFFYFKLIASDKLFFILEREHIFEELTLIELFSFFKYSFFDFVKESWTYSLWIFSSRETIS